MHGTKERLPQLDGIRGLAVLMVVWWHYFNCQAGVSSRSPFWTKTIWQMTSLSWSGVDLFFVLSGFLITGILLDESRARNLIVVFYFRRAARIFPLYFLVLIFAGVLFLLIGDQSRFSWLFQNLPSVSSLLTFTQNIEMGAKNVCGGGLLSVTWSLAIEEQFYLLWPWIVLLCGCRRKLLIVSVALCIYAPALRYATTTLHGFVSTPHRMDSLLFGAIAAVLMRNENFVAIMRANPHYSRLMIFALLPGLAAMSRSNFVFGPLNHVMLGLFFTAMMLHCVIHGTGKLARLFSVGWLRWCGGVSFAIYLLHQPFSGLLHGAIFGSSPSSGTLPGLLVMALSLALVLAVSALSMRFFESRFLTWGRRLRYEKRAADEPDIQVPAPASGFAPARS